MFRWTARLSALAAALALAATGCGGGENRPAWSASGRLIVGGKAAGGAHVVLHPLEPGQIARAVGITKPDGTFELTTYRLGDGAPSGEYAVTIYWPDPTVPYDDCAGGDLVQHDQLCGMYFNADESPLRVTIRPEPNKIELQAADLSALFEKRPKHRGVVEGSRPETASRPETGI